MVSHQTLIAFIKPLDWVIFFFVLLATGASVLYGQRLHNKLPDQERASALELLLMGRKLTLPLFVATLVATWYGGIFGVTALTFEKGIYNFLIQGVFWYVAYFIFALFLVKRIRRHQVLTLPELAKTLVGPNAAKATAVLNFMNLLPLAYTISLGLFLQAIFGGSLLLNTSVGVALVTAYSLWGGFRAVVFSDLVQFFFMILSVVIVVIFAWAQMGHPLTLVEKLPATHFDITGGESISTLLIWGLIALSTLVDPSFYQRCLAAKSEAVARKGILISIGIWAFFDCCTTLGALYARAAMPGANPQNAYLQFSMQLLPDGFRGLVLSGILATILSTLDSFLFTAATCISYDFLKLKEKFRNWHHHVALIFVSVLSIVCGIYFEGNVVEVWRTLGGLSSACLLFPLLTAQVFPGKLSDRTFTWAVALSGISVVSWKIFKHHWSLFAIDEFYIGILVTTLILFPSILRRKS